MNFLDSFFESVSKTAQFFEYSEVTTTDATVTSALSVPMGNDTVTLFQVWAVGVSSGGTNGAGYSVYATYKKDGAAAPAIVGAFPENAHWKESDSTWGGITFNVSTPSVNIQVTGKAATTINWKVFVLKLTKGI